jgi:hypothetical protein
MKIRCIKDYILPFITTQNFCPNFFALIQLMTLLILINRSILEEHFYHTAPNLRSIIPS